MSRYLISHLLGLVGAALGGVAGYFLYRWIASTGLYGGMIPGAFLGLGCGLLARHPSYARGVVCGIAGLALGLFADWTTTITDKSFWEYVQDFKSVNRVLQLMILFGAVIAFWIGKDAGLVGRSRREERRGAHRRLRPSLIKEKRLDRYPCGIKEINVMAVSSPVQDSASALRAQQLEQAEELLFSGESRAGFAKAIFRGEFRGKAIFPYPELTSSERPVVEEAVAAVRAFADEHIDAAAIDRDADIPRSVIDGLAELGVMGMAAPVELGGRGFSQMGYCRIMEVIGGHCAATAVFVNAHHSIGLRALVLFGTPEQKARWLPPLSRAEKLAAFRADRRTGRV